MVTDLTLEKSALKVPVIKPDLSSLIWPLSRRELFRSYWQKKAFITHCAGRLASLEAVPELFDPARLAQLFRQPLQALWRTGSEGFHAQVSAKDGVVLYQNLGATLYFNDLQTYLPITKTWLEGINNKMGYHAKRANTVSMRRENTGAYSGTSTATTILSFSFVDTNAGASLQTNT